MELFFIPNKETEYNVLDYAKLNTPNSPYSNNAPTDQWTWVHTAKQNGTTLKVYKNGKPYQTISEKPWIVVQTPGAALGYNIVEWVKGKSKESAPHFRAHQVILKDKGAFSIRLIRANGTEGIHPGYREARPIKEINPLVLFLVSLVPFLGGCLIAGIRAWHTRSQFKGTSASSVPEQHLAVHCLRARTAPLRESAGRGRFPCRRTKLNAVAGGALGHDRGGSQGRALPWNGEEGEGRANNHESLFPAHFGRYHEPFLGGGAVFFRLAPTLARLTDVNEELILTYAAVRDQAEDLVECLRAHPNSSEHYYQVRATDPAMLSDLERAARMRIYLNKTCYNGLHRVNRAGRFNVPYGRYAHPRTYTMQP